jgi:hypothetical protein
VRGFLDKIQNENAEPTKDSALPTIDHRSGEALRSAAKEQMASMKTKPARRKTSKPEKSTERTLAQAQMDSRRALVDRGGKLLHVRIEAGALSALSEIKSAMGFAYDREAIAYALNVAAKDLRDDGGPHDVGFEAVI